MHPTGIEPVPTEWKSAILPLNQRRHDINEQTYIRYLAVIYLTCQQSQTLKKQLYQILSLKTSPSNQCQFASDFHL